MRQIMDLAAGQFSESKSGAHCPGGDPCAREDGAESRSQEPKIDVARTASGTAEISDQSRVPPPSVLHLICVPSLRQLGLRSCGRGDGLVGVG